MDTVSENNGIGTYIPEIEPQVGLASWNQAMDYDGLEEPFYNHTEQHSLEHRTEPETRNLLESDSSQEAVRQGKACSAICFAIIM